MRAGMKWNIAIILSLLLPLFSCTESDDVSSVETTVILDEKFYRVPMDSRRVYRILWQRSYPKEFEKLIRDNKHPEERDPFTANATAGNKGLRVDWVPNSMHWSRSIIPRVFEQLGYPTDKTEGASAMYYPDKQLFKVAHTPTAIVKFEGRFPEFEVIPPDEVEQDTPEQIAKRVKLNKLYEEADLESFVCVAAIDLAKNDHVSVLLGANFIPFHTGNFDALLEANSISSIGASSVLYGVFVSPAIKEKTIALLKADSVIEDYFIIF